MTSPRDDGLGQRGAGRRKPGPETQTVTGSRLRDGAWPPPQTPAGPAWPRCASCPSAPAKASSTRCGARTRRAFESRQCCGVLVRVPAIPATPPRGGSRAPSPDSSRARLAMRRASEAGLLSALLLALGAACDVKSPLPASVPSPPEDLPSWS